MTHEVKKDIASNEKEVRLPTSLSDEMNARKREFVRPLLKKHEKLPEITNGLVGTWVP